MKMKRVTKFTAWVFCLLAAAVPMSATAKDEPTAVLAALPEKAGMFESDGEVQTFEEHGLGASRLYRVPGGTWITLYLYDLDTQVIRNGVEDQTIKDACKQAMGDIREMERQGHYADVKMAGENKVTLKLPSQRKLEFLNVTYSLTFVKQGADGEDVKLVSQLFVTGLRDHIFKIRVSSPEGSNAVSSEETEAALKLLMDAVLAAPKKELPAD
ncbi:hypothetical protein [Verrucomicrobium sp. BvORR106]|uniref:hypothetical protein n=1 Tax=Verrucomicrobium sp. BvORR106 TaxID=1403819 RepID=UPI000A7BA2DD|nr:hypothetical protein [Verrucomicrobium sp. BvORR106]